MAAACRVCGNLSGNRPFSAREMMFGTRERFSYFECGGCGGLQIARPPADLSAHYPPAYYSFRRPGRLKRLIKGAWLSDPFPAGAAWRRCLSALPGVGLMPEWMSRGGFARTASILEVGSGSGARLLAMRAAGFSDLTGVDPFVSRETLDLGGATILRKELKDLDRRFDVIMLHHSLEHMDDQSGALLEVRRHLAPEGCALVRIPIAAHSWRAYGPDWVQLDAPRHLFVHTLRSFKMLAEKSGFGVSDYFFDSSAFQFWGSEQYARDIPLRDARSHDVRPWRSPFSLAQLRAWARQAEALNLNDEGDQAAFYLRPSTGTGEGSLSRR